MLKFSFRDEKKIDMILKIIILVCCILLCESAYQIYVYIHDSREAQSEFNDLGKKTFEELMVENEDLVGWIRVGDTRINYPVMQTKDDPEYYLHRDFYGNYSAAGTPFMDADSDIDLPTSNWLIYGHHMKSGIMFHDLIEYADSDFLNEHPTFQFVLADEGTVNMAVGSEGEIISSGSNTSYTYEVIAVAYSKIYDADSDNFKYYQYAGITTEKEFNEYLEGIRSISIYDIDADVKYGDQLVTLSTCAYQTEDGRFFIVGRRLD